MKRIPDGATLQLGIGGGIRMLFWITCMTKKI